MSTRLIRYELARESDVCIGTGMPVPGWTDTLTDRDEGGFPKLRDRAAKGLVRAACLRVVAIQGDDRHDLACRWQRERERALTPPISLLCTASGAPPCGVCATFGSTRQDGAWVFSSVTSVQNQDQATVPPRAHFPTPLAHGTRVSVHNAIDRESQRAHDGAFYSMETVRRTFASERPMADPLTWHGEVSRDPGVPCPRGWTEDRLLHWVVGSLLAWRRAGRRRRRGFGAVRARIVEATVGGDGFVSKLANAWAHEVTDPTAAQGVVPSRAIVTRPDEVAIEARPPASAASEPHPIAAPVSTGFVAFLLEARLDEPCAVSAELRGSFVVPTLDYVPGARVRAEFARRWVASGRSGGDSDFERIFWSDDARFPDLQPCDSDRRRLPLSACVPKGALGREAVGFDLLLDGAFPRNDALRDRRHDGRPLVRRSGWFRANHPLESGNPSIERRFATAVGETAIDGTLRVEEQIGKGTRLAGVLFVRERIATDLRGAGLLPKCGGPLCFETFLGSGRSGRATVWVKGSSAGPPPVGWLGARHLAMQFESDAIFVDKYLRPVTCIEDAVLPGKPVDLEIVRRFVGCRTISGWNRRSGLPKPDDVAIERGSSVLFEWKGGDDRTSVETWAREASLGLGLRRSEGFGRVTFEPAYHVAAYARQGGPLT